MAITKRPTMEALLELYTSRGLTDSQIARQFSVNLSTVYRWKQHYGIETTTEQVFKVRVKKIKT